ncbi:MAG: hypothetical protein K6U14_00470 [Firmicutes bacterium]|nr:hypothetical protein [Alicyclobacillaceae bacterium]MCL6496095.1 hypothetical protein [Bacillota bacterium]
MRTNPWLFPAAAWLAAGVGTLALTASPPAFAASMSSTTGVDLMASGEFPTVVATANVAPNQPATIHAGALTIQIPAGAFTSPVVFRVVANQNAYWQQRAPAGDTVLTNFAFVVKTASGQLVEQFQKPVLFTFTNPDIGPHSQYWNITAQGKWVLNPIPPKIQGDTLTHPIAAAVVGWAVTSPAPPTTPTTGLPLAPVMGAGAAAVGIGAYLLTRRSNPAR